MEEGFVAVSAGVHPLRPDVAPRMSLMLMFPIITDRDRGILYLSTADEADKVVSFLKENGFPKAKRV
jgi:hypothetical protein